MKSHGHALLVVLLGAFQRRTDVTLSKIFPDHAILQRDLPLPIRGTAEPGEKVTVKLGDAQETVAADAMGKRSLKLPAMKMNAIGQDMIVTGKNTVTVKDFVSKGLGSTTSKLRFTGQFLPATKITPDAQQSTSHSEALRIRAAHFL